jgi:hypothetical protein
MILLNCSGMLCFSFDEFLLRGFHIQALAGSNKVNGDIKTCHDVDLFCSNLSTSNIAHFRKRLVYTTYLIVQQSAKQETKC